MFFGFQTPTSEYAQALVDFHHYAFFFLILVTVFVIWMIKLSLLFVVREKNLLYKRDLFYIDLNNKWFGYNGEFYFLIKKAASLVWSLLGASIQERLTYLYLVITIYRDLFYRQVVNFFSWNHAFVLKATENFWNVTISFFHLRTNHVNFMFDLNIGKNFFSNSTSNWIFYSRHLVNLALSDINKLNYGLSTLSDLLFKRNSSFFNKVESVLGGKNLQEDKKLSSNFLISIIPFFVLSSVREGFSSVRFSHWTWGGKDKTVFLLFTGNGDAYNYPSNEFYAFDENVQMPQSLKFFTFYNHDLWRHPFLFFQNVRHRLILEWVWTFIPTFILLILVVPSLYLLYSYDKPYVTAPYLTFKAIGHQWYWSYEYWDYTHANGGTVTFDSYMLHEEDLELGQLRLLEVDRRVVLPAGVCIRLLTTSTDVLHSWAVPAFGVKIDSIPGRLNQFWLVLNKPGVFYGQCSELCGVNHGFMPIAVEVVSLDQYLDFINLNIDWFNE